MATKARLDLNTALATGRLADFIQQEEVEGRVADRAVFERRLERLIKAPRPAGRTSRSRARGGDVILRKPRERKVTDVQRITPERLAEALYVAMKAQPRTFVQGHPALCTTNIDGTFNLTEIAGAALRSLDFFTSPDVGAAASPDRDSSTSA